MDAGNIELPTFKDETKGNRLGDRFWVLGFGCWRLDVFHEPLVPLT